MSVQSRSLVRSALLASVASAALPGIASGAVVLYTNDADFTTDASGLGYTQTYVETFEENDMTGYGGFVSNPLESGVPGPGFPSGLDAPDLAIVGTGSNLFGILPYGGWPGIPSAGVGTNSEFGTVIIEFGGGGVDAVAFEVLGISTFTTNIPEQVEYTILSPTDEVMSTGVFPTPDAETGSFMGVVSDAPMGSIEIRGSRFGLDTQEYVDNVQGWHAGGAAPGDANGDGLANFADILAIIGAWGSCPGCPEDLNGNGNADFADILEVIANWS
ncbi:MAG: hypothetical protein GY715_12600 [Planctomycetes bacterium]|nr:hypothetical protein [Planctomycetota bacterium]